MKIKKRQEPVFLLELSDIEATAALHAMRAATAYLSKKRVLDPHEKAALGMAKRVEELLVKQGARNKNQEILERYTKAEMPPRSVHGGVRKTGAPPVAVQQTPPPPVPLPQETAGESSDGYEDDIRSLIADDDELLSAG